MWQNQVISELTCICSPVSSREGLIHFEHQKHGFLFYENNQIFFFFLIEKTPKFLYWERVEKEERTGSKRVYSNPSQAQCVCTGRSQLSGCSSVNSVFSKLQCPLILYVPPGPWLTVPPRPITWAYKTFSFCCLFLLKRILAICILFICFYPTYYVLFILLSHLSLQNIKLACNSFLIRWCRKLGNKSLNKKIWDQFWQNLKFLGFGAWLGSITD